METVPAACGQFGKQKEGWQRVLFGRVKLEMSYISKRGCQEATGCEFGGGVGGQDLEFILGRWYWKAWGRMDGLDRVCVAGRSRGWALGLGFQQEAEASRLGAGHATCLLLSEVCVACAPNPSQLGSHLWATDHKGAEWEVDLSVKTHCHVWREKSLNLWMIRKSVGL